MLCFIWLRYVFRKLWLAVLLSTLSAASFLAITWLIRHKKGKKLNLKLKEKEDAENMFLSLCCSDNPIDFFAKLAEKKHKNVVKHKSYITVNHVESDVKTLLYADLNFEAMSTSRFMDIYTKLKKEKATKIVICCKSFPDKTVLNFCENFPEKFIFLDEYETYQKLYKFYNYYPKITHRYSTTKKMLFKDFLAFSFNKKRTKGYLFSALILIFSSLFVRTTLYYCIIASILVICATVSQFNHHFNIKNTTDEVL